MQLRKQQSKPLRKQPKSQLKMHLRRTQKKPPASIIRSYTIPNLSLRAAA